MTTDLSMQLAALLIKEQMGASQHNRSGHPYRHRTRASVSSGVSRGSDVLTTRSR